MIPKNAINLIITSSNKLISVISDLSLLKHFTAFSCSIQFLYLGKYRFLQVIILSRDFLLLQGSLERFPCFYSRPVYQESVVQDVELVVEETEFEALRHLVRPALPGEPLVVPGLLVGPDVYRLPVLERLHP